MLTFLHLLMEKCLKGYLIHLRTCATATHPLSPFWGTLRPEFYLPKKTITKMGKTWPKGYSIIKLKVNIAIVYDKAER